MQERLDHAYREAIDLLRALCTEQGILASAVASDNYKRLWARDSMICGLAGILADDSVVIEGMRKALIILAENQNEQGIIPSNVFQDATGKDLSYGSLVGRVDANTWFILGACLYYRNTGDTGTWERLRPAVERCRGFLKSIEFNGKGWIYTPLSGNWADEYPVHGYTLYDNVLRLWAEALWMTINGEDQAELQDLIQRTLVNFWPSLHTDKSLIYQKRPFKQAKSSGLLHFCAFILPGIYDTRFDAAANGLAMLLFDLSEKQKKSIVKYLETTIANGLGKQFIPAFWPPIYPEQAEWAYLKFNHAFDFKNNPHDFHNGGIWPVWTGLFCLGLHRQGMNKQAEQIGADLLELIQSPDWAFQEYISSKDFKLKGKQQMGFTASGIVFMYHALRHSDFRTKLGL